MPSRSGWLSKALYEMSGELHTRLTAFGPRLAQERPLPDCETALELACLLRDRELIAAHHIEQCVYGPPVQLHLHELEWLEPDTSPKSWEDIDDLMHEFSGLRHRTCSLFWGLTDREWQITTDHRFVGKVTLEDIVVRLHEHDIEGLWKAKRLADALGVRQPHFG